MKKFYKIAIIGFGSIGKRHLHNVVSVLKSRDIDYSIDLIRVSREGKHSNRDDILYTHEISSIYGSYESAPNDYDIVFITNPTHLHYDTIRMFVDKSKHMFIEKPIFHTTEIDIDSLNLKKGHIYYVACPLRYSSIIQYIKNSLSLGEILSVRVISSSYLPEWRPEQDYRQSYSAFVEKGGGVAKDLIHEWDYLNFLFGIPKQIFNINGKYSGLEINSDDVSIYIAAYDNFVVEVHLDYFGKFPIREIQLITQEDTILADFLKNRITFKKSGKVIDLEETKHDYYVKEMEHFFDMIEGKEKNKNDVGKAYETFKMAMGEL